MRSHLLPTLSAPATLTAYVPGPSGLIAARVRCAPPERPRVLFCASLPAADSRDQFKQARARLPKGQTSGSLLLGRDQYQIHLVDAPNVPPEERAQAVKWKLQDQLAFPAEEACVDVIEVPGDPNRANEIKQLFVMVARQDLIRTYIEDSHRAKLPLSVIDVPEMAQRNIARLYEADARAVGLLCIAHEGSLLTFTHKGELLVARELEITLPQVLEATGDAFEPLMERIALEVQRTCDHVDRRFHFAGVSRVLVSPLPKGLGVVEYLVANLSVRVQQIDLTEVLDLNDIADARDAIWQAQHLHALGAALREPPVPA